MQPLFICSGAKCTVDILDPYIITVIIVSELLYYILKILAVFAKVCVQKPT